MIGNVPLPAKMLRPRLISRRDGWRLLQGRGQPVLLVRRRRRLQKSCVLYLAPHPRPRPLNSGNAATRSCRSEGEFADFRWSGKRPSRFAKVRIAGSNPVVRSEKHAVHERFSRQSGARCDPRNRVGGEGRSSKARRDGKRRDSTDAQASPPVVHLILIFSR